MKIFVPRILCILAAGTLIAGSVFGAATWDGSESSAWSNPDNWAGGALPTASDETIFNNNAVPNFCTITSSDTLEIERLTVRVTGQLYMDGGSLTTLGAAGRWRIGWRNGDDCLMIVRGGTIDTTYTLQVCEDRGAYGYLSVSNATVSIGRGITLGAQAGTGTGGEATMVIEPNTSFSCSSLAENAWESQVRPNGRLTLNGGLLDINATLNVFTGGVVRINDGAVQAGNLIIQGASDNGLVDVTKGSIEISSNIVTTLQGYVTDGKLTGYSGAGSVVINYDAGTETTTVTAIPEPVIAGVLCLGLFGLAARRR